MTDMLKINVNGHTEKKNGLSYLSWAWAWAEVLKIDPKAQWHVSLWGEEGKKMPACFLPDGTAFVGTYVTIKDHTQQCMLPVMDHRNKAIKNPDAFAINTAIMRCMTKTISMHGLGLYIYAGEDLPEDAKEEKTGKPLDGAGEHLSADRKKELTELAGYLVECHERGKDLEAARMYYEISDNDEKVYVWKELGPWSKLRASIKANSPHQQKEAA